MRALFSERKLCKTPRRAALIVGVGVSLTACTNTSTLESERAKTDLIGMTQTDLMNCAGLPHKEGASKSGRKYLAYTSEKTVQVLAEYPSRGFYPTFGYNRHRSHFHNSFLFYGNPYTREENRICTATFGLKNNRVASLSYTLNDNDSRGMRQCYQIVRNCLPNKPK